MSSVCGSSAVVSGPTNKSRVDRQSWMHDNAPALGPLALTQICVPGAHNAATHSVTPSSRYGCDAPGLLRRQDAVGKLARHFSQTTTANWARCQSMSVAALLSHGVRYLDLRLAPDPKRGNALYVTHSKVSESLTAVIEQLYHFSCLTKSCNEFIILDCQAIFLDTEAQMEELFWSQIHTIASRCVPNAVPLDTPLSELWSRSDKERIFVVVDRKFQLPQHPRAFPRFSSIESRWKNKQSVSELVAAFDTELGHRCTAAQPAAPGHFHVTQAVLTPGSGEIVRGLLLRYKPTLENLVSSANPRLLRWFYDWNTTDIAQGTALATVEGLFRNVLMIDFVERGHAEIPIGDSSWKLDLVELCVHMNTTRPRAVVESSA